MGSVAASIRASERGSVAGSAVSASSSRRPPRSPPKEKPKAKPPWAGGGGDDEDELSDFSEDELDDNASAISAMERSIVSAAESSQSGRSVSSRASRLSKRQSPQHQHSSTHTGAGPTERQKIHESKPEPVEKETWVPFEVGVQAVYLGQGLPTGCERPCIVEVVKVDQEAILLQEEPSYTVKFLTSLPPGKERDTSHSKVFT